MTCPEATGPCTVTHDGFCTAPKTLDESLVLTDVFIQGVDGGFEVSWNTFISSTDTVTHLLRQKDSSEISSRSVVDFNDGSFVGSGLVAGAFHILWLRRENSDSFGNWQMYIILTDADWNIDSEVVEFLGETVYFGTDVVLVG